MRRPEQPFRPPSPDRPESLIYQRVYAPTSLRALLESAETRSRIRRLPVPHLFFGLKQLEEEELLAILPHVTGEQWQGVLDLDIWNRDQVSLGQFLFWQRFLVPADPPVARKLLRAAEPELWELTFRRSLRIYPRTAEDEYEGEPGEDEEWLITPDKNYLLVLPSNPDQARLLRALLLRLYELEPELVSLWFEEARARTSLELEEEAYQNRKRRIEELGFQDYFDAIEVYTYLPEKAPLPLKQWDPLRAVSTLPMALSRGEAGELLLLRALASLENPVTTQALLEELFYVCNKVLSADRVSPTHQERVLGGIRKALTGINLGLDVWAEGRLERAREGIQKHYLQSFFQLGHSRLLDVQREARRLKGRAPLGSFLESVVENLCRSYPLLACRTRKGIRKRFLRDRQDLARARGYLLRLQGRTTPLSP